MQLYIYVIRSHVSLDTRLDTMTFWQFKKTTTEAKSQFTLLYIITPDVRTQHEICVFVECLFKVR